MKISATVITYNEERNIRAALESLSWADEIIVVDSYSDDATVEIARQFTDKIFIRDWPGYCAQKTFAAEQARHDWVLNVDADERVSPELRREIEALRVGPEPAEAGFEIPRLTQYLGRWIKHSGWYPDYKLRLYDRRRGGWRGDFVHESVAVEGPVHRLRGHLVHHTVQNSSEHHNRIDRYTTLAAQEAFARGKRAGLASMFFSPTAAFLKSYVFQLGFLDGVQGWAIARFASHYVFLKKLKLWEMRSNKQPIDDEARGRVRDREA